MNRNTPLKRGAPLPKRGRAKGKRKAISTASQAQRQSIAGRCCIACGRHGTAWDPPIDPAHLCPRSMGGCDDALCVVPLCRECHRLFDDGKLDLSVKLEPRFRAEAAHCVEHLGLFGAVRRISGRRDYGEWSAA